VAQNAPTVHGPFRRSISLTQYWAVASEKNDYNC